MYLGMRVNRRTGLRTLLGFGPKIAKAVAEQPEGLLLHENFVISLLPPHMGMRQYWRDFDSLERWARSEPHRAWWKQLLGDTGGTGFWHEAYFMRGGMETVYDDIEQPLGFLQFAPVQPARGALFSARTRAQRGGEAAGTPAITEEELYTGGP